MILSHFDPMKTCFKCGIDKPYSEFYKHAQMGDGYLGKCKTCTKSDVSTHRRENIVNVRAYDRSRNSLPHRIEIHKVYAKTEVGKISHAKANRKNRDNSPEKSRARSIVGNAIRDGKLLRKPCVKCGNPNSHGHHEDYSKPLDVIWLCPRHHRDRHKELGWGYGAELKTA